jgi:hypothetical protein
VHAGSSDNWTTTDYWNYCNYMVTADCGDMCTDATLSKCSDECNRHTHNMATTQCGVSGNEISEDQISSATGYQHQYQYPGTNTGVSIPAPPLSALAVGISTVACSSLVYTQTAINYKTQNNQLNSKPKSLPLCSLESQMALPVLGLGRH